MHPTAAPDRSAPALEQSTVMAPTCLACPLSVSQRSPVGRLLACRFARAMASPVPIVRENTTPALPAGRAVAASFKRFCKAVKTCVATSSRSHRPCSLIECRGDLGDAN